MQKNKQSNRAGNLEKQKAIKDIRYFLLKAAICFLVLWMIFSFVFGIAVMKGEDMYPRIRDGDLMLYYRLEDQYHTGDVVTFINNQNRYTGRIVAMENDVVDISEDSQLMINGNVREEEIFYPTDALAGSISFPCTVPVGSVFILCDFRTNCVDSRIYGPVQVSELDGKVITILRRRGI